MSVDIEPFELSFRRPFTSEVAQTLTIKNPSSTPVAFKVKTTAPKQYACPRPNPSNRKPDDS
ncbi:phosphatidylinositol-binding protein scs2 [Fusarium falciforme]|nr:phosphatidylinositol-binding protein scs2 [Fusarium falciforme]